MNQVTLFAIPDLPNFYPGDDLAAILVERLARAGEQLLPGDVLVLAQKIVSKVEGRLLHLHTVEPGEDAQGLAQTVDRDPRIVQVVLDESRSVVRARRGLLVVEQRNGWVCANAGVDRSNVEQEGEAGTPEEGEVLALLPLDADASAARLRSELDRLTGVSPAVIICDSHGRAWRIGTMGVAIGCAGLPPVWNQRGLQDLYGYRLQASEECIADELAAAASLIMGQSSEGRPAVIVRGYHLPNAPHAPATSIQRAAEMDAFR